MTTFRQVEWMPSPNYSDRPKGDGPRLVIIHGTAGRYPHDLGWLTSNGSSVSCHYYIRRTGKLYQLVAEAKKAWHAGKSIYQGKPGVNDYSIGIELENDGEALYTAEQYDAVGYLAADIARRRGLDLRHFLGHQDVSGKHLGIRDDPKTDPWGTFSWDRFQAAYFRYRSPEPQTLKIAA